MKSRLAVLNAVILAGTLIHAAGCSKPGANSGPEEKITGRSSDPPVALQARWNPSNRYFLRFESTAYSEFPRRDQPAPTVQETTLGLDYSVAVTNVQADGARAVDVEIRSVQLEMARDDERTFYFDSENRVMGSDGSALAEALGRMRGVHLSCRLSAENQVVKIDGLPELLEKAGGVEGRDRAVGSIRRMFTPQLCKQLLGVNSGPAAPVRIGESWTARREVSAGLAGSLAADVTCTFKGWQKREQKQCALIIFKGDLKPTPAEEKRRRARGPSLENGTIMGTMWFDPAWEFPLETGSDQVLITKSTRGAGRDTNAEPRTFSMTFREHAVIKLVEVRPVEE